jgi:hypothetical protein
MSLRLNPDSNDKPEFAGLLAEMEAEWRQRGWSLDVLKSFTMKDDDDDNADGGDDDDGDDDGDGDDDTDDGDDDDSDDDDADDSKDKGKGKKDDKDKDDSAKLRSEEAKRWRLRFKAEKQEKEDLKKRLDALEKKDKPELDQVAAERDELKNDNDSLKSTNAKLSVRIAVRDSMAEHNLNPKKSKAIERLVLDNDDYDVDISDDGEVEGIDDALSQIAEDYPEWVLSDDDTKDRNKDTSGGPSGKQTNGKRRNKDGMDQASLEKKFPALRR